MSSAYVKVCSLLKDNEDFKEEVRQELLEMKEHLESGLKSYDEEQTEMSREMAALRSELDEYKKSKGDDYKETSAELAVLRCELQEYKKSKNSDDLKQQEASDKVVALLEARMNELSSDVADLKQTVKKLNEHGEGVSVEPGDLQEGGKQMEERRQKRKSAHLEDSVGKMKEFANNNNRGRIDSGISISSTSSANGLTLADDVFNNHQS